MMPRVDMACICCCHRWLDKSELVHYPVVYIMCFQYCACKNWKKPSFSADPSHRSLPFLLQDWLHGFLRLYRYFWSHPFFYCLVFGSILPSVLWRCWLGGRKGIRPVKTEWWGAGVVICLERSADLHMAQLMPLPLAVSCCSKILIDFTFVVPSHLGSPGQRAVKRVYVCMCVCLYIKTLYRCCCAQKWQSHKH